MLFIVMGVMTLVDAGRTISAHCMLRMDLEAKGKGTGQVKGTGEGKSEGKKKGKREGKGGGNGEAMATSNIDVRYMHDMPA